MAASGEEPVGEGALPVAGAGGDERLPGQLADRGAGAPASGCEGGTATRTSSLSSSARGEGGARQRLGGQPEVDLAGLQLGGHDRGR